MQQPIENLSNILQQNSGISEHSFGFPILTLLLLLPFISALGLWLIKDPKNAKFFALAGGLLELFFSLILLLNFDSQLNGYQFVEKLVWISSLDIQYLVAVDGISILFFPLSALLFCAVIISSWNTVHNMQRLYFSMLLLLLGATMGIFMALDTILFFLFWELTLLPIYFLINLFGSGPNRRHAATKYTILMLVSGIPILFAFIYSALQYAEINGQLSFSMLDLLSVSLPIEVQTTVFFLLLIGFGFKAPIFPFHTWLPTVAMEGPIGITAIMTGLKLGAYGLIRFMIPLAPDAALEYHWLLAGIGLIGVLYGAVVAISQTNIRRMLAFSSISHVGLVILGISAFSIQGIQGAIIQLLNFTVVASGLYLITGFLHHRTGSSDILNLGGSAKTMPLMTTFFFIFGLASLGVPGTNGFISEHLILFSAIQTHSGAGFAALFGIILTAGYFFRIYQHAFYGPIKNPVIEQSVDLLPRELSLILVLCSIIFIIGLVPNSVLSIIETSSHEWLHFMGR